MTLEAQALERLYADESVADYRPEPVRLIAAGGSERHAVCYLLPEDSQGGANPEYARSLLALAESLGFPDEYLGEIQAHVGHRL